MRTPIHYEDAFGYLEGAMQCLAEQLEQLEQTPSGSELARVIRQIIEEAYLFNADDYLCVTKS